MDKIFSDRIHDVPVSFIREILKTAVDPRVISFAGGLPNRKFFPVEEIRLACDQVLRESGSDVLQYSTSEGHAALRQWISERYASRGIKVEPERVIITTGSQQALDLAGKILVNDGDQVAIEEPGYLGAIQALSLYRPRFRPVQLDDNGPILEELERAFGHGRIKLFYTVPNFQNPSGITHSLGRRQEVARVIQEHGSILVEDNPYGEIQFSGEKPQSYAALIPENTVLLGSFSKIFAPAFRIGWIAAPARLMEKIVIAKQASDLHTDYFAQRILSRYLETNDIDAHIEKIRKAYAVQKDAMIEAIREHFPAEVSHTNPDGGMFLWVRLPEGLNARELFDKALEDLVAFVPGDPFSTAGRGQNSMRLNFSSVDPESIREGIRRLGHVLKEELRPSRRSG